MKRFIYFTCCFDFRSKVKLNSENRSRSVPDICLTPRSKRRLLQIEHPHFDDSDLSSNKSCTDASETVKSDSERTSSDLEDVFPHGDSDQQTYSKETGCLENGYNGNVNDANKFDTLRAEEKLLINSVGVFDKGVGVSKSDAWKNNATRKNITLERVKKDYAENLIDKNANQWKATTLV